MRIPKWEKIDCSSTDPATIEKLLQDNRLGEVPILLVLKFEDALQVEQAIESLSKIAEKKGSDVNFPYPLYIIHPLAKPKLGLNVVRTPKELPDHFWVKVKRLKGKEESLLKKTNVISQKLRSHDLDLKREYINNQFGLNRVLRDLTRECAYYETLLSQLREVKSNE